MNPKEHDWKEKIVDSLKKPLERIWNGISKERLNVKKVEVISEVYSKALMNKDFVIKEGMAKVSLEQLEKEPKTVARDLASILKEIE